MAPRTALLARIAKLEGLLDQLEWSVQTMEGDYEEDHCLCCNRPRSLGHNSDCVWVEIRHGQALAEEDA